MADRHGLRKEIIRKADGKDEVAVCAFKKHNGGWTFIVDFGRVWPGVRMHPYIRVVCI